MKKRIVNAMLLTACIVVMSSGCSKPKENPWMPRPRVDWADLSIHAISYDENSYRILNKQTTKGLFPAAIAVTRVAVTDLPTAVSGLNTKLVRDPRNEFLQWNEAFDDQMAISEVFPLAQRDLGGAETSPQQITRAITALHARIGFVYAFNELSPDETEMIGTLIDTKENRILATLHAHAVSIPVDKDDPEAKNPDLWKVDSRGIVRLRFAKLAHACIREMILRDEPAEVESSAGWKPLPPSRPAVWPPRG